LYCDRRFSRVTLYAQAHSERAKNALSRPGQRVFSPFSQNKTLKADKAAEPPG
jgi:hypothetical protein